MTKNKTRVGTELKMSIDFSYPLDHSISLDNITWEVDFYCDDRGGKETFKKMILTVSSDCQLSVDGESAYSSGKGGLIRENGSWFAPVDTTNTGAGDLKMKLTAYIPSGSQVFGTDSTRTEVAVCTTNVIIE